NPSDLEGQLSVSLPVPDERAERVVDPKPAGELAFPSDLTVTVRAQQGRREGDISALFLDVSGKVRPVKGLKGLYDELVKERKRVANKEAIRIEGDDTLKVKRLLEVMDVCRKAGFKKISFVHP